MVLQADPPKTAATQDWHRIFDSLTEEHDYVVDEIEGALPAQLTGTLYRNGPGNNEVGGKPFAHLFDGHGMLSQFAIDGGRVHYRNRFVRTHKYEIEKNADEPAGARLRRARTAAPPARRPRASATPPTRA